MANTTFTLNGKKVSVDVPGDMPLLWVLRDRFQLLGTRYGCGIGQCGSCMVLLNGKATQACLIPAASLAGTEVMTIEGLSTNNDHPVQRAWIAEEVPQCGYCQSGQILAAVSLLNQTPRPTDDEIDAAMRNVLCRCGTYPRIRKAIHHASRLMAETKG